MSESNSIKISVITPTFNSEKVIAKNLESVIKQNYRNFEHIIIDNKSTDNTLHIAEQFYKEYNVFDNLKIISEKDNGISDAFNKGIRNSSGDIIAILNSDDLYVYENLFADVIEIFSMKNVEIVYGDILFSDQEFGTNIRQPKYFSAYKNIVFQHPSMFISKKVYERVGLYNERYSISMDFEFFCRLADTYKPPANYFYYLNIRPMVQMSAGGSSYNNELQSIKEIKAALKENNFWNLNGLYFVTARLMRTKLKIFLSKLGMKKIVQVWRMVKWGNVVKQ